MARARRPARPESAERRWQASLGAWPGDGHTEFRLWAPGGRRVELVVDREDGAPIRLPVAPDASGYRTARVDGVKAGARYSYEVDGAGPFPDPAGRFLPDGVHSASMVVDPAGFDWSDQGWRGLSPADVVLYEVHVGTFTPEGTFAGAAARLPYLVELGVTAVELMPVAAFPGARNWGYDGVGLYAPAACYGTPDELRAFVDRAHALGLGVFLDVVYNHLGPDGAYLAVFSPHYFDDSRQGPWGASLNFDGAHAGPVRDFFIENALHWIHEYHVDGLRLDATHTIHDESTPHFLRELSARVQASVTGRQVLLVAEDHRNLAKMVRPASEEGWGLDGVWADDLHHQLRVALAGDRDGYYADYSGTAADIATTIAQGWFFTGQHSLYLDEPRGTDPAGLPPRAFVVCLQNHDQVGNRALGERLHHQIDLAAYRAASLLLLTVPETPLLFMGQEWGATAPFLYFTDHHAELGRLVTEGRRREFARFAAFASEEARHRIPDPQAPSTFEASRLDWSEPARAPHAGLHALYRALLALRRSAPALQAADAASASVRALDADTLALTRTGGGQTLLILVRLRQAGHVSIDIGGAGSWDVRLTSEDADFADDGMPPRVTVGRAALRVAFARASALVLEARR